MSVKRIVRLFRLSVCSLVLTAFAGCWTVRETPPPEVAVGSVPDGKNLTVQVAGFDATVTTYDAAYGYTMVSGFDGPYYCGRRRLYGGYGTTTYTTTTLIPRTEPTPVYRDRATDALERAGCIVQAKDPAYRIEVRFDGPFDESGDTWTTVGWMVCTLFTADFGAQDWTAKLKIHDLANGRLLCERDLSVRDEALVWGPIPFFSPGSASRTAFGTMKVNCLTALTDLAVAEAVSFLSGR